MTQLVWGPEVPVTQGPDFAQLFNARKGMTFTFQREGFEPIRVQLLDYPQVRLGVREKISFVGLNTESAVKVQGFIAGDEYWIKEEQR